MNSMRERYQQEQLWSDKIRKMSTYGTFGLLTFNLILFIMIQFVFEPRKRKRLLDELLKVIDENNNKIWQRFRAYLKIASKNKLRDCTVSCNQFIATQLAEKSNSLI